FDAVTTGSVEMGHSGAYYHKGKIPASPFFTAIPFGMSVLEHNAWIYYGGGLEEWRKLYAPMNVIPFPGGNTGIQMAGWFNREINSIEDFRGLKMRIPGIAGEVFSRAGGAAINIPGGELYTSMQTGVIDATEWVGPYNDRSFGLNEVGEYYYTPGWHEPEAMMEFLVNESAWNSLPEDLQAIVRVAADAVNADMLAEYTARNAQALRDLRAEGIEPRPLPTEVLAELKRHAMDYYDEESARDEDFARIYKQYTEFQDMVYEWLVISEKAMFDYREELKEIE
ncbi:MAG: TRAP transporter substrate-binding protein DctP, partial [Gammaproteobacteria bacterium]